MIPSYSCKWIVVQAHTRFTVINKRSYSFHVCVPFSRENAVSRLSFQNYRKAISLVRAKMAAIVGQKVRVEDAPYARHSRQDVVVMTWSRAFQVLPSAIFRIFYVLEKGTNLEANLDIQLLQYPTKEHVYALYVLNDFATTSSSWSTSVSQMHGGFYGRHLFVKLNDMDILFRGECIEKRSLGIRI